MQEFFIIGSQRSGTTMVRLALDSHPNATVHDEILGYKLLCSNESFSYEQGTTHAGYKVPRFTEQLANRKLADTGIEENTSWKYDGRPIIYLVRDVRDTICSMMNLKVGQNTSWLDTYGRQGLKAQLANQGFVNKYRNELTIAKSHGWTPLDVGALLWQYKTQPLSDYLDKGWPVLPIRYETLVKNPEQSLKKAAEFLGLEWSDKVLQHHKSSHDELYGNGLAVGNTDPKRAIDDSSVDQWKNQLSEENCKAILEISGELNSRTWELAP